MTAPTLECPKCARLVPAAPECAACGVVFAKLRDRRSTSATGAFPPGSEERPTPTSAKASSTSVGRAYGGSQAASKSPVALWGFLLVVAFGALAAVQWVEGKGDNTNASGVESAETAFQQGRAQNADSASGESNSVAAAKERLAALPAPRRNSPAARLPSSRGTSSPAPGQAPTSGAALASRPGSSSRSENPRPRWVPPDSTWFEGASGFEKGLTRARDKNQAVLVYFHADWCGYCRQLESDLLNRAVVQEYTKYLVKIRINPEKGASERAIADSYGVKGYPSLFVHPAGLGAPKKVRSMTKKSGGWRSVETRDYVDRLAAAAGERFGAS